MTIKLKTLLFSSLVVLSFNIKASQLASPEINSYQEQKPHEHGVAQMEFVIDGKAILLTLNSPLYNLLGFEHKPKLGQQKQAVKQQLKHITSGALIGFNATAKCSVYEIHYQHPFEKEDRDAHTHQEPHKGHPHKTHKDITFEYEFTCGEPQHLNTLDASSLFSKWPNLHTLRIQWIGQQGQSAMTLTPNKTTFSLK